MPLPATCVFLAFAFPFQALPLLAAGEGWNGGIAVFSFCKQTKQTTVVTCPERSGNAKYSHSENKSK